MADKKFLDAMKKKFVEDPTEKRTQFYNMGGWTQSERKTAFVNEGKEIAEKRVNFDCSWLFEFKAGEFSTRLITSLIFSPIVPV